MRATINDSQGYFNTYYNYNYNYSHCADDELYIRGNINIIINIFNLLNLLSSSPAAAAPGEGERRWCLTPAAGRWETQTHVQSIDIMPGMMTIDVDVLVHDVDVLVHDTHLGSFVLVHDAGQELPQI